MLHTSSTIAPGVTMVVSCLLPAKATARASVISEQVCVRDRNVWEGGRRWGRDRRDITAKSSDRLWEDVLDDRGSAAPSEGSETTGGWHCLGQGHPGRGTTEGCPC